MDRTIKIHEDNMQEYMDTHDINIVKQQKD